MCPTKTPSIIPAVRLFIIICLLTCRSTFVQSQSGRVTMFRGSPALDGQYQTPAIYKLSGLDFTFGTGATIRSTPAEAGNTLFFGSNNGVFYALDALKGTEKWHTPIGAPINSSAAIAGKVVYFAARDQNLYALSTVSGKLLWKYYLGAEISDENYWDFYSSSPIIAGNKLYVGSGDGNLYAFDLATQKVLWKYNAESRIRTAPALSGNTLVFGGKNGYVYALNKTTGSLIWKYATAGTATKFEDFGNDKTSVYCSPAVDGKNVLVGARDGFLYCLDLATGKKNWSVNHNGSWVLSTAVKDGIGYAGSGSAFFAQAVDMTSGREIWRFKTLSAVFSSITITGDLIYFADQAGNVYALNRFTGKQKWCFPIGYRILSTPVLAAGRVYITADDGNLYALKGSATKDTAYMSPRKVVYWEGMKTDTSYFWFGLNVDTWIRDYFATTGYEQVDSVQLKKFMNEQITGKGPSVVVFSDNRIPHNIVESETDQALIRKYLDAGGKIVLFGNNPLAYKTNPVNNVVLKVDWNIPGQVFGIKFNKMKEVGGYNGSIITSQGKTIGLRGLFITSNSIDAAQVSTVLTTDEFGRANAWIKNYGGRPGTGLMQLSLQRSVVGSDIYPLRAAIEYGVSW